MVEDGVLAIYHYLLCQTDLQLAAKDNDLAEIERLLSLGAHVDVKNEMGQTALHIAATCNRRDSHLDTIELLLKKGANVDARDEVRQTALHIAAGLPVTPPNVKTVELLLRYGADANAKDVYHQSPLFPASHFSNIAVFELLVKHGSDLTAVSTGSSTILHRASKTTSDEPEIIKYLLKNGSDIEALDRDKCTPLLVMLRSYPSDRSLRYLLKYADVNPLASWDVDEVEQLNVGTMKEVVLGHVAKLRALGLTVRSSILESISRIHDFRELFSKCTEELSRAKNTRLKNSWVTFFNLLVDSKRKLKNYAGNENLVENFKQSDCLGIFPIYGAEMMKNFEKAVTRRRFFDDSSEMLSECLPIFSPGHLIVRDVLDCLTFKNYVKFFS